MSVPNSIDPDPTAPTGNDSSGTTPPGSGPLSGRFYVVLVAVCAVCALATVIGWFYDIPLFCGVVLAAGLLWVTSRRAAVTAAVMLLPIGLLCSSYDSQGCSAWWRGKTVVAQALGDLPFIGWSDLVSAAASPCYGIVSTHPDVDSTFSKVGEKSVNGRELEQFQTDLGRFWIAAPGRFLLSFLTWKMTIQHSYEHGPVRIEQGDIVIDCGAHVGVFTKYALSRGARRVMAIEPEPTNIACLEENLADEIASGRVTLLRAGVWDVKDEPAFVVSSNSAGHNVAPEGRDEAEPDVIRISVFPLDELVRELSLDHVDFIKMDIEGAETRALRGAEATLRRFRPRVAVCTYHGEQDARDVAEIIRAVEPSYHVSGRDIETQFFRVRPKVLYFHAEGSADNTLPQESTDDQS